MIKQLVKSLFCVAKNHNFIDAGKCPFTGNNYMMCIRCEEMVVK